MSGARWVLQDLEHPDLTALLNMGHPVDSGFLSARSHSAIDGQKLTAGFTSWVCSHVVLASGDRGNLLDGDDVMFCRATLQRSAMGQS